MGDVRVRMNPSGVRELLCDAAVAADLGARAERIAAQANAQVPEHGYAYSEPFGTDSGTADRAFATVYTRTNLGKAMQARHNTLTKALDAGRG